jgi:phosphate transport system substrate-binding protein
MSHTALINKSGKVVQPDDLTFEAAASGAKWDSQPGFGVSINDQAGDKVWPITSATFILMYKNPSNPARSAEALKFFNWALRNTKQMTVDLDYVVLPDALVKQVETSWSAIKDTGGKSVAFK